MRRRRTRGAEVVECSTVAVVELRVVSQCEQRLAQSVDAGLWPSVRRSGGRISGVHAPLAILTPPSTLFQAVATFAHNSQRCSALVNLPAMRALIPISLFLFFLLNLLPAFTVSTAPNQPPPPPQPPAPRLPNDFFHGWAIFDFVFHPTNSSIVYIIDDGWNLFSLHLPTNRVLQSATFSPHLLSLAHLAFDSTPRLYVTARDSSLGPLLLVFDPSLTPLFNRTLSTLSPPCTTPDPQLVVDSDGYLYLATGDASKEPPAVWVLDRRRLIQVDRWSVKLPITASYLLALDAQDTVYFQETSNSRQTYLVSTGGDMITSFDFFSASNLSVFQQVTDLAIDSSLSMYLALSDSPYVWRFDVNGAPLPPYAVFSTRSRYRGDGSRPQVELNAVNTLHTYDSSSNSLAVIASDGGIRRTYASQAASLRYGNELLQDERTGDLLFNAQDGSATSRISSRDGSLLQEYTLPARLPCQRGGVDVGRRSGALYTQVTCGADRGPSTYYIRVEAASGQLQREFQVDQAGYRLRVDEDNGRLYLAGFGPRGSRVHVLDLQGRWVADISPRPALGYVNDIVVTGDEVVVLDDSNHRLIVAASNGTVTTVIPLDAAVRVTDLAWDRAGALYVSVSERKTDGQFNSSVVRLERDGAVSARYVTWGSQWDGAQFQALVAGDRGLFAYEFSFQAIFVWTDHRTVAGVGKDAIADAVITQAESA